MKQLTNISKLKAFFILFIFSFIQTFVFAQDSSGGSSSSSVTTHTTTETQTWYTEPWVWIVGGILVILLLVALLRGNRGTTTTAGRTDRVTVTKSTSSDTDAV